MNCGKIVFQFFVGPDDNEDPVDDEFSYTITADVSCYGYGEDSEIELENIEVRSSDDLLLANERRTDFLKEHGDSIQELGVEAYFSMRGTPPDPGLYRDADSRLIEVLGSADYVDDLGQKQLVVVAKRRLDASCLMPFGRRFPEFVLIPLTEWQSADYKQILPEPMTGEYRCDETEYVPLTSKLLSKTQAMAELNRRRRVRKERELNPKGW